MSNASIVSCYCYCCKKSCVLMPFKCRFCEFTFCLKHQLPETHKCDIKKSQFFEEYKKEKENKIIPNKCSDYVRQF